MSNHRKISELLPGDVIFLKGPNDKDLIYIRVCFNDRIVMLTENTMMKLQSEDTFQDLNSCEFSERYSFHRAWSSG